MGQENPRLTVWQAALAEAKRELAEAEARAARLHELIPYLAHQVLCHEQKGNDDAA